MAGERHGNGMLCVNPPLECGFVKGFALYLYLRSTCIVMSRDDLYVAHKAPKAVVTPTPTIERYLDSVSYSLLYSPSV
jgi:hypothetical protein